MTTYLFTPPAVPSLPIRGQQQRFAINRIFCVGRNYHAHAVEMGRPVDKSVEQVVRGDGAVERMTVSVMVPRAVDAVTLKAIRQLVATAVGLRESRGPAGCR